MCSSKYLPLAINSAVIRIKVIELMYTCCAVSDKWVTDYFFSFAHCVSLYDGHLGSENINPSKLLVNTTLNVLLPDVVGLAFDLVPAEVHVSCLV